MEKIIKLQDVAKAVGVSVVTVSNALSGKKGVSEKLRRDILQEADELGYRYSKQKAVQGQKEGKNIGVLVPARYLGISTSFYWDMYQQLALEISRKKSFTLFEILEEESEEQNIMPRLVSQEGVDGLIVIGWVKPEYARTLNNNIKTPLLFLDFYDDDVVCDSILSNNYIGMYKVTKYVLDQGHREVAFVGNVSATGSIRERYAGYLKALLEYNIPERKDWLITDRDTHSDHMELHLPKQMPSAFICNSDYTAGLLKDKLDEAGLKIPEDISVAAYDNYLHGNAFLNELTTYDVDMEKMAQASVNVLMKKIQGLSQRVGLRIVDGSLIVRSSVKAFK